jgi:DNA mismatch repair protein MutL
VTDDGTGMSRDDALLCLERHATSKIVRAEDLSSAIATMGFRGEALPSIASVSRFTLTTRERESASPEGTQIVVNGGTITEVKAAGSAPGTSVEVRQLFFNLPARRKFLRTEETEAAHIQHYLTLAALAFPEVAFTFIKDGGNVWQLPSRPIRRSHFEPPPGFARTPPCAARRRKTFAREFFRRTRRWQSFKPEETDIFETALPFAGNPQSSTLNLPGWGLIGSPGVSRATRDGQHLFVNRRPGGKSRLNYALIEGYHTR